MAPRLKSATLGLDLWSLQAYLSPSKELPMATEAFEEIAETFDFLDDWEDRYRHVIELGKAMPPLDDSFKVPR
jgi:sulfur transfer protein SufE